MSLTPALRDALQETVPPEQRATLPVLLNVLDELMQSQHPNAALSPDLVPLFQSLAGRQIKREDSLINFGSGHQMGDITFQGPVVGGNVIHLQFSLTPSAVEAAEQAEQVAPHVFLCYSRADGAAVEALSRVLHRFGLRTWRDIDDLHLGRPALRSIRAALESVAGILVYVTPQSLRSPFVQHVELAAALERARHDPKFPIIPVLDGVTLDELERFSRDRRDDPRLTDFQLFHLTVGDPEERAAQLHQLAHEVLHTILPYNLRHAPKRTAFTVELFSRSVVNYDYPAEVRLDWVGNTDKGIPSLETWGHELHPALEELASVFQRIGHRLPIKLRPHGSRLSVALAFGYVFRKSAGFQLWVEQITSAQQSETGAQWWRTDDPASRADDTSPLVQQPTIDHDPAGTDLTLEVTMSQPMGPAVAAWIAATGARIHRRAQLQLDGNEINGSVAALAAARQIRAVIDQERLKTPVPTRIHFFFAGPVALAALIGWHLNKVGPFLVYEFNGKTYTPAIQVGTD
ncbi:MAG: toll/interleukin-1 receptor domain-containing protein [Oscillochloris sp.]|nr:toll/interleukin-1 receptor domain-containing protein [Oscillochloris sp.]